GKPPAPARSATASNPPHKPETASVCEPTRRAMPRQNWSDKRERRYEHGKGGLLERGQGQGHRGRDRGPGTVNKERARAGEAKTASPSSTEDNLVGPSRGLRSHREPG